MNLYSLLGITNVQLNLDSKAFNSPLGWLSGINFWLDDMEVEQISPNSVAMSTSNLLSLQYGLLLTDQDSFYQQAVNGYFRFGFQWDGLQSYITLWPEYPNQPINNDLDFFQYVLPQGVPVLSEILLNSIPNLEIQYTLMNQDPEVIVEKTFPKENSALIDNTTNELGNIPYQSWSAIQNVSIQITVFNNGSQPVWGIPLDILPKYGLTNSVPINSITDALSDLGYDPATMFNDSETARYFPLDPFGTGLFVGSSVDLSDLSNEAPYSTEYSNAIVNNAAAISVQTGYTIQEVLDFAANYNNTQSVFDPDNWILPVNSSRTFNYTFDPPQIDYDALELNESFNFINYTYNNFGAAAIKFGNQAGTTIYTLRSNEMIGTFEHNATQQQSKLVQVITPLILPNPSTNTNNSSGYQIMLYNWGSLPINNVTISSLQLGIQDSNLISPFVTNNAAGYPQIQLNLNQLLPNSTNIYNLFQYQIITPEMLPTVNISWQWSEICPETSALLNGTALNSTIGIVRVTQSR